mmetsp:Transcript_56727/g.166553  ORF Transcript_56727/g.166553 Transcript_56727/m.166553 type:complete len:268 (-) Transcript_56727:532-1335(-)
MPLVIVFFLMMSFVSSVGSPPPPPAPASRTAMSSSSSLSLCVFWVSVSCLTKASWATLFSSSTAALRRAAEASRRILSMPGGTNFAFFLSIFLFPAERYDMTSARCRELMKPMRLPPRPASRTPKPADRTNFIRLRSTLTSMSTPGLLTGRIGTPHCVAKMQSWMSVTHWKAESLTTTTSTLDSCMSFRRIWSHGSGGANNAAALAAFASLPWSRMWSRALITGDSNFVTMLSRSQKFCTQVPTSLSSARQETKTPCFLCSLSLAYS